MQSEVSISKSINVTHHINKNKTKQIPHDYVNRHRKSNYAPIKMLKKKKRKMETGKKQNKGVGGEPP